MNALKMKQNAASVIVATAICYGGTAFLSNDTLLMSAQNAKGNFFIADTSADWYVVSVPSLHGNINFKPIDMDNASDLDDLLSLCDDFTAMSPTSAFSRDFTLSNIDEVIANV